MKITGKGIPVSRLTFVHRGMEAKWSISTQQMEIERTSPFVEPLPPKIEFKDLIEVEILITALQDFRSQCKHEIGTWKRES